MIKLMRQDGRVLFVFPQQIVAVLDDETDVAVLRTTDGRGFQMAGSSEEVATAIARQTNNGQR